MEREGLTAKEIMGHALQIPGKSIPDGFHSKSEVPSWDGAGDAPRSLQLESSES